MFTALMGTALDIASYRLSLGYVNMDDGVRMEITPACFFPL